MYAPAGRTSHLLAGTNTSVPMSEVIRLGDFTKLQQQRIKAFLEMNRERDAIRARFIELMDQPGFNRRDAFSQLGEEFFKSPATIKAVVERTGFYAQT